MPSPAAPVRCAVYRAGTFGAGEPEKAIHPHLPTPKGHRNRHYAKTRARSQAFSSESPPLRLYLRREHKRPDLRSGNQN